jgi:hypothetical protein
MYGVGLFKVYNPKKVCIFVCALANGNGGVGRLMVVLAFSGIVSWHVKKLKFAKWVTR